MSKFESYRQSRILWGGVRIAGWLLAGGGATGLLIYGAAHEHAELATANHEVSTLLDKAGYQPFIGDMNGPDEYDAPLADAREVRDDHQATMLWYGVGALGTGSATIVGLSYTIYGFRRPDND